MFSYRQGSKGFLPTLLALFLSVRVTTLPSSGAFENLPLTDHLMLKEARKKVVTCNYSATGQQVIMDRQSPTLSKETTYHQRSIEHLGQAGGIDTDNFPLNNTLGSQRYLPHSIVILSQLTDCRTVGLHTELSLGFRNSYRVSTEAQRTSFHGIFLTLHATPQ
ncbi:uncharacterized protein BDCG_04309 [Blastomyces dermatitidis ER-3]|uniref:Uncharacterized protein n=1 Tax=Ajellomyces dermatitidis (strain ER-3 / ATCC MYA-2586) TaxID=559297 RepID=A0ABP2F207_AJEDR|nr:uncharacterized protein BDCG_04309 [Blastomyces dermatitidis ER-3]EEQ89189.2 hypothetical protein BDCG_04309 [Blastomyces dermatitidis ER-3]